MHSHRSVRRAAAPSPTESSSVPPSSMRSCPLQQPVARQERSVRPRNRADLEEERSRRGVAGADAHAHVRAREHRETVGPKRRAHCVAARVGREREDELDGCDGRVGRHADASRLAAKGPVVDGQHDRPAQPGDFAHVARAAGGRQDDRSRGAAGDVEMHLAVRFGDERLDRQRAVVGHLILIGRPDPRDVVRREPGRARPRHEHAGELVAHLLRAECGGRAQARDPEHRGAQRPGAQRGRHGPSLPERLHGADLCAGKLRAALDRGGVHGELVGVQRAAVAAVRIEKARGPLPSCGEEAPKPHGAFDGECRQEERRRPPERLGQRPDVVEPRACRDDERGERAVTGAVRPERLERQPARGAGEEVSEVHVASFRTTR